ncbi:MAG: hypothetical protein EXS05_23660, partial [Planctomycetaceae bacterium]|nr:hypothetical protein [Planctomycetaceae bacterium]
LRAAIVDSGKTHYRIGKDAGVAAQIIDRFVSGKREDIRLATAAKLCEALGLELKSKGE